MISQTSRYALRILGYLVSRPGELVRGEEISRATGISANYLSKILNQLRKNGFVESQKGWHGGFKVRGRALSRPIRDILTTIDGVESVDPRDCAFGLAECDLEHPCPLHQHWEQIRGIYTTMLSKTLIADLASSE